MAPSSHQDGVANGRLTHMKERLVGQITPFKMRRYIISQFIKFNGMKSFLMVVLIN
jgi:hypothetical protein